jgi:hypothetical protein
MKVVRMVKKYFIPIPDMVCQSSSDFRSTFLLPFALAERQTHMWPDEIIEDLKEKHLPFEFLFFLRCRQRMMCLLNRILTNLLNGTRPLKNCHTLYSMHSNISSSFT